MAVSKDYLAFIIGELSDFGEVQSKRMFGGAGLYYHGYMFALVADDQLYMKVDDGNRAAFEEEGMMPFTIEMKGKAMSMSYYGVPESALEDRVALADWARLGFEAALRAKTKKPAKKLGKRR